MGVLEDQILKIRHLCTSFEVSFEKFLTALLCLLEILCGKRYLSHFRVSFRAKGKQ